VTLVGRQVTGGSPSWRPRSGAPRFYAATWSPPLAEGYNTLSTSGAQMAFTVSPQTTAQAVDAGYSDEAVSLSGGFALPFNVAREPFSDMRARRAVALAYDAEDLNETVFAGGAEPIRTILREDSADFSGIEQLAPDKAEAQALFDELADEGHPVSFTIAASPSKMAAAEWFLTTLASYDNVTVEISSSPTAQLIEDVRSGNYQLLFTNYGFYDLGLSLSNVVVTGAGDTGGYSNSEVDAALAEAAATTDPDTRAEAYATIEQTIADDLPLFFTTRLVTHLLTAPEAEGMAVVSNGIPDWSRISLAG
jgi:peptide/nickel transport system substrate-binding protein